MDTSSSTELLIELESLRHEVITLKQAKADLEIAIETIAAHGDALVAELQESNQKLEIEISERLRVEASLQTLLETTFSDNYDLQTVLELTVEHSDFLERSLQQEVNNARAIATIDSLTQIPNRRRLEEYIQQEWANTIRQKNSIAFLLCDVDYFKLYNDRYGHQAGDECLQQVAQAISTSLSRPLDLAARYGGEEFAVILPNTNAQGGIRVAEVIHSAVAKLKIPHLQSPINDYLTLSIGISATVPNPTSSFYNFINNVDLALYQAKTQGRNCHVFKSYNALTIHSDTEKM